MSETDTANMTDREILLAAAEAFRDASDFAGAALIHVAAGDKRLSVVAESWGTLNDRAAALMNALAIRQQGRKEKIADVE